MPRRTNLLLILTDDQGYWAMGCAGNDEIRTPNLDRLAATGLRFTDFFCASPVCSPARASILTGRIPSQHGIHDFLRAGNTNLTFGPAAKPGDEGIEYLAGLTAYTDLLAQAGYRCGLSGKWHMGFSEKPQKSFEFWDVHAYGAGSYFAPSMIRDGDAYEPSQYASDLFTDNALRFLQAQQDTDRPFCLNVHFTAPHAPWQREHHPPELWDDYHENCPFKSTPDVPMHPLQLAKEGASGSLGFTSEERKEALSGYFAALTQMDANVGRLLDWLEENGERQNTLVVFSSDNGMNMGHHGIYGKGNGTFPPNMFDTSVKVPMLVSRPGSIPEGKVVSTLHSHYDLMPTLLEYLGVDNPLADSLPGRSFAGVLDGKSLDGDDHVVVFDEYGPTRMVRTADWKYVHRYPFGDHELYNLVKDPDEEYNLIHRDEHRAIQKVLQTKLEVFFARYADPERDGSREAVLGRGQIDVVGPAAEGRKRFGDDLLFENERLRGAVRGTSNAGAPARSSGVCGRLRWQRSCQDG